ncbi:MAG: hypothetical protein KJ666_10710 [Bacteroidetes bacterium]|nr:hypothetical protein [Bacteroidota bacterium]
MTTRERTTTANSGFVKLEVQWLIEHSSSHQLLSYVDSSQLRNPQLHKPAKRWASVRSVPLCGIAHLREKLQCPSPAFSGIRPLRFSRAPTLCEKHAHKGDFDLIPYKALSFQESSFKCPNCNAYSHPQWYEMYFQVSGLSA